MTNIGKLQNSINKAFGFEKTNDKPVDCNYSKSQIKDMSKTMLNKVLFVSGFNGDDVGKACIKMIRDMEKQGYISTK